MEEHTIKVNRRAHIYTLGNPNGQEIEEYWIICHGYAHLGSALLRRFDSLNDGSRLLIAPEGLSKFYWNGFSGKVVASWMTSKNRLDEIEDYADYLTNVYQRFIPEKTEHARIILFGFSQGCATLSRWIMRDLPEFHHLILWGGMLPDDLDYQKKGTYFKDKHLHIVYGDDDEFITPVRLASQTSFVKSQQLQVQVHTYAGRHEVPTSVLADFAKKLR